MKKKIILSIFVLLIIFANIKVNASSFTSTLVGKSSFEDEVILELKIDNIKGFNKNCNDSCSFIGELEYDKQKLELLAINSLNEFEFSQGSRLVLSRNSNIEDKATIMSLHFKNKGLSFNEKTTISIKNITASDGINDTTSKNISKTIQLVKKTNTNQHQKEGNNSSLSNDNSLSSISLSTGEIHFQKDVLKYKLKVPNKVSTIHITATPTDQHATIEGNSEYALNVGTNLIQLKVTAEDKSTRNYSLEIIREAITSTTLRNTYTTSQTNTSIENKMNTKRKKDHLIIIANSISILAGILIIMYLFHTLYKDKKKNL